MPRKVNKTDPRNVAKPVSQLRGAAKQARISRVTKAEAGPATVRGGMAPGAGRTAPSAPKPMPKPAAKPAAKPRQQSMLTNQRNKVKATKLEAGPATIKGGQAPGAGRSTMQRTSSRGRALGTVGSVGGRAALFYQGIQANNTAKGTLAEAKKKYGAKATPQKQGPTQKTTQTSFNKKSFDQAFSAARSSGAKEFTWRGKRYNTKIKGEK